MEDPDETGAFEEDFLDLDFSDLNITEEPDLFLDEAVGHIQANLEDELVQEALRKGVDLRKYSREIEVKLRREENQSIDDYIAQGPNIAKLHYRIKECDGILEEMESMLSHFQSTLTNISAEIQTLQGQSLSINTKLKNRQAVRKDLHDFVDNIMVQDHLVLHICDTPASEREFTENLHELDRKLRYLKEQDFRDALAVHDPMVRDELEKLKHKATQKTRDFLLQRVYQLRKPMANYHMLQNQMLNYRYFTEFLMAHNREVALHVRKEYVDTMGKVYYSYFKEYASKLMKLEFDEVPDKDDLIGTEDSARRSGFFSSRAPLKNRSTIFTLGNRDTVITTELEDPIVVIPQAQKTEKRFAYEALFRSVHYAVMDHACREFLFIVDFFKMPVGGAMEIFKEVMGRTLEYLKQQALDHMASCYDAIGLLLCVHVCVRYHDIMARRDVSALDDYWGDLLSHMWPRFEHVMELNITSIRELNPQKLGHVDTRPHYITRRYAEFSAALVSINNTHPDDKVLKCLATLQIEVENFALRMAAEFPQRKEQLVFLINNYDMMLGVLMERTSEDSKEVEGFQKLLHDRTEEYIDEALAPHFGGIMAFVRDVEVHVEGGHMDRIKVQPSEVVRLVRGFANNWKGSIESLNRDVMRQFTNFRNGTGILQGVLTKMIQFYHRFTKLLSLEPFKDVPVRGELLNIHHIMVEVKKYKQNF